MEVILNQMSNNCVINSVAFSTFLAQNPISNPRFSVNDYVKHVYTKGKRGVVINVDPTRFSYFSTALPAYLVGWESHCDSNGVVIFGEESWVSGGSIRKVTVRRNET